MLKFDIAILECHTLLDLKHVWLVIFNMMKERIMLSILRQIIKEHSPQLPDLVVDTISNHRVGGGTNQQIWSIKSGYECQILLVEGGHNYPNNSRVNVIAFENSVGQRSGQSIATH